MKILSILGSPRSKGNSAAVAGRFCEEAARLGAEVETVHLNKLTYRGCQACMACKNKQDSCVLQDDLTPVLAAVHGADLVLLATPVYFGDVSGQMKSFIDRTYSFLVPDFANAANPSRLPPGKRLVFVQTQGNPDEAQFGDVFPRYAYFLKWYGFRDNLLLRGCGLLGPGDAGDALLEEAAAAARTVMGA